MDLLVPWEKADPEFTPAVRFASSEQVVKVNGKMRAIESTNPNMHQAWQGAAPIVAGTHDCVSELAKSGGAKRNGGLLCGNVHASFSEPIVGTGSALRNQPSLHYAKTPCQASRSHSRTFPATGFEAT